MNLSREIPPGFSAALRSLIEVVGQEEDRPQRRLANASSSTRIAVTRCVTSISAIAKESLVPSPILARCRSP